MTCQHILVVEDDTTLRETLKDVFELEGYKVVTAENGLEGLKKLDEVGQPCLIFLDLMMPVMDGWEFLAAVKREGSQRASIPIAVISAAADIVDVKQRYDCAVLKKPARIADLLQTVVEHCSGQ